ncbi:MAG TPA: ABC transporter substrate-binding protein [Stellaceae bacterium]|nr:ABC transporter substrate-binding protein [Stellaceae bacterium]
MIKRRDFLFRAAAAGAAVGAFAGGLRTARAAEPVTVFLPFDFTPEYSDIINAASGGHFAKEGLDATVRSSKGVQSLQQLVAKQGQFIRNIALDVVRGVSVQGLPLVCIATIGQGSAFNVVSLKDKPILNLADFKGKTIGIIGIGGAADTYLEVLLAKGGLTRADVNVIAAGNNPGEVVLLKQGRLDAFMCTLDTAARVEQAGEPVVYWSTDKFIQMPGFVHVTTRDIAEKKPDLVRRYVKAIKASVDEILTHPLEPIFRREAKEFEMIGLKDMAEAVRVQQLEINRIWLAAGKQNVLRNLPEHWQAGIDALRAVGFKNLKDPTYYYTNEFVDAA